jgi:hypothetical protein
METSSDLARSTFAFRIQESVEAKLGRCRRCMTASALVFVASWLAVVVIAQGEEPNVPLVAAATAFAVIATALSCAHAIAYALRRLERPAAKAPPVIHGHLGGEEPAPVPRRGGGCGCGK